MALRNKLGITDSRELADTEERISKTRAAEMFDSGRLDELEAGSFAALAEIHQTLFGDIYDFAGELRNENIAKGSFRFASALYLADAVEHIEKMPQTTFDEIVDKYTEMNVAHPFREGNGRAMRIWLDCMLKASLGLAVDWSRVDREDYLFAMERSPIRSTELKLLLKTALTDRINDRDMFYKGTDHSYSYEGCDTYKTEELRRR